MSIHEIPGKIKRHILGANEDLLIVIIIILASFSSFGLGRLSAHTIDTDTRVVITDKNGTITPTCK